MKTKVKLILLVISLPFFNILFADTPVTLFQSYAGNVNFVGIEATRRTQPNGGGGASCAVVPAANTNSAVVTGIPAGATIRAAHLYWAGSGSTPDYSVTFEGVAISAPAGRRYTANYTSNPYNLDFFSGVADVTAQVILERNGTYTFSGLTVDTGGQHCSVSSVMAGWSLIIIYEDPAEDFRVVNLYEGFQAFRYQNITLIPDNFRIPSSPINGKIAHITWEGDQGNSAASGGFSEQLTLNGTDLVDGANPLNNQYNSVSTIASTAPSSGSTNTASYGIDYDAYNISSLLNAGDTSATSTYGSGGDLVILSSEIISVTNTPVSDLAITKTHSGNFNVGQNAIYTLNVTNNGPIAEPGPIVVTDTLPAGLSYVSATGSGWGCGATGQLVTCTRTASLANGAGAPNITLTVAVSSPAFPSVTNTASVSGTNFDNIAWNDSNSDTATVTANPVISLQKTSQVISDGISASNPKRIPGSVIEYTITATNSGLSSADNNSIVVNDAIPTNTEYVVNSLQYLNGTPSSGMTTAVLQFSTDGTSYTTSQSTATSHIRVSPQGTFLASSGSGNPSFQTIFQVKVK